MANEEQLSILKQDFDFWNRWRENNPGVEIDLHAADLHEVEQISAAPISIFPA